MKTKQQAIKALDTISRQAAITIPVMPIEHRKYQTFNLDDAYEQGWIDCQDCIKELPSAEPERKKGQWIWCTSSDHLKCSECGTRAPMYMDYADGDYQEWLSDFCPEFGCEMKGFEEDE